MAPLVPFNCLLSSTYRHTTFGADETPITIPWRVVVYVFFLQDVPRAVGQWHAPFASFVMGVGVY
jgi:hypothetical protein